MQELPGHFRAGTEIPPVKIAFVFNAGGIGDYIHWTPAIRLAIGENPFLEGFVVTPTFFADLAKLWFAPFAPRFRVLISDDWGSAPEVQEIPCVAPNRGQMVNALGAHLTDLGFMYYHQKAPRPANLPFIWGDEAPVPELPSNYVVITPLSTDAPRRMTQEALDEVISYLTARSFVPVLLGKRTTAGDHKSEGPTSSAPGVIDLIDKTTLLESACIMSGAHAVLGIDNGLLHLASCTKASVVFAFTNVRPELRLPRRERGRTITLRPPPELECRFCTNEMRYIIGHNFKNCLYKDNLCASLIKGRDFIRALKELSI